MSLFYNNPIFPESAGALNSAGMLSRHIPALLEVQHHCEYCIGLRFLFIRRVLFLAHPLRTVYF